MAVSLDSGADPTLAAEVNRRLLAYTQARSAQFKGQWRKLQIFAKDEEGALVGGIDCQTKGIWLEVGPFWLDEAYRGQGLGTRIMDQAEEQARARGCTKAYVDTFSFQAPAFYKGRGYRVWGTLPDYPPGHAYHLLVKEL